MFTPTKENNFLNAYAYGETVTQGIADYCEANGHGVWSVDGNDQNVCPRCGHTEIGEVVESAKVATAKSVPFGHINENDVAIVDGVQFTATNVYRHFREISLIAVLDDGDKKYLQRLNSHPAEILTIA